MNVVIVESLGGLLDAAVAVRVFIFEFVERDIDFLISKFIALQIYR